LRKIIQISKKSLVDRGYPQNSENLIEDILSEIKFTERDSKLLVKQNNKEEKEIMPFVS